MATASNVANGNSRGPAARGRLVKILCRIAGIVLMAYLLIVVAAMFLEDSLIFIPTRYPGGDWQSAQRLGLPVEEASFKSADGVNLHGWYVPCKNAKAAVLFCHGNAGNITHRADILAILHRKVGVSTLIFDYRGYGRSEGRPNEEGVFADARAARRWLADREKIAETDVVVMGESIGGAVAVDLAARDGARALVLESTFDTLANVAAYHHSWLPIRWLMRTKLDSAGKIGGYRGPLLQAHGDIDRIIPLRFGRRLFDAADEPKQFLLLSGHDHNDPMPEAYYDALAEFLK